MIYKNTATLYTEMKKQNGLNQCLPLEGNIIEITKETLEANIALIKKVVNPEDKDDMTMRICPRWFQHIGSLMLFCA